MYDHKTIATIVPAYNEATLINRTIGTMPAYVDALIVVDDASTDDTAEIVAALAAIDTRIKLIRHRKNCGVGAAIITGYKTALMMHCDIIVVMAGDNQMDPQDLSRVIQPLVDGEADYVKGNRFVIPFIRYIGGLVLGYLTSLATGYKIIDSQTGYTAITQCCLSRLPLGTIYPRYGMPNDMLVKLSMITARIQHVNINPIYGNGAVSGLKIHKVIWPILSILGRGVWQRITR